MGKSAKIAKLRKDKYYQLAKEHGYRSRAAFKLIQLNRKFGFLNNASVVVDLCAAPGGWLQVVSNVLPISSIVVGVDLFPIKPIKNTITLINDITTPECLTNIKNHLNNQPVDCVLHDGAPNVGQSWEIDAFGQSQLTLHSLKMASKILKIGGWFITKIFRSRDYCKLMEILKKLFQHVHSTKPLASRKESAEIFVVCQGYIGLKTIDTSILDFKNVFREQDNLNESLKSLTLKTMFKQIKKAKPNRDGYNTDSGLLYSTLKLSEFLSLESNILNVLSNINRIDFDVNTYDSHDITPTYIKEYCKDLKVLGYQEFKQLLDWRRYIRSKFGFECNGSVTESNTEKIILTDEQILENEIEIAEKNQNRMEKLSKKKDIKAQRLLKLAMKTNKKMESETNIDIDNTGLFSKFFINNTDSTDMLLPNVTNIINNIETDEIYYTGSDESSGLHSDTEHDVKSDMDDNPNKDLIKLESQLDAQMEFLRNARLNKKKQKYQHMSNTLNKQEQDPEMENHIHINESMGSIDDDDDDEELDMNFLQQKTCLQSIPINNLSHSSNGDNQTLHYSKNIVSDSDQSSENTLIDENSNSDDENYSVVPTNKTLTPEILALATRMKRSKKEKQNIIDSLWNRHCKGKEDVPQWFVEDEAKATIKILPITKQDVEQYRQQQKILQAQPRKKVLEARQRRKTKVEKLIEKARVKSEKLTNTEDDYGDDTINHDKVDSVKRIYKKISKELKRKNNKTYVVAKRHLVSGRRYSKPKSVAGPYKVVDPRQKKDKSQNMMKAGKKRQKKFSKRRRR